MALNAKKNTSRTHDGNRLLGVHIGVHRSGKGVHIGVYKPSHLIAIYINQLYYNRLITLKIILIDSNK